jgi:hypothetical protein
MTNVIDDLERVAAKLSEHLADEPPHACVGALALLLAATIKRTVSASKQGPVFRQMVELMADDLGFVEEFESAVES